MEAYQAANELFVDELYENALSKYNEAIESEPKKAEFYLKRSACFLKLDDFLKSLQDANKVIELEKGNKTAYLRKGIAYFEMEEYKSAKEAFEKNRSLCDNQLVRRWIRKCDAELLDEDEDGKIETTREECVSKVAEEPIAQPIPSLTSAEALKDPIMPLRSSIRHEWYQSPTTVCITIFAKNITKEQCDIDSTKDGVGNKLSVSIELEKDSEYILDLVLCDDVDPEQTVISYLQPKVEIKLFKVKQSKWLSLEKTQSQIATLEWDTSKTSMPEYPSSSKIKKNWDLIDKNVEEEKPQGDAALNKLFEDIFFKGTDDQKRAMKKSFYESGGTVLSTDWKDVGARTVEGSAPKGAELKPIKDLHA